MCTEVAEGRVPVEHSRGRAGWPPRAQVADHHLRCELGLEPLEAIGLVGIDGDDVTVSVAGETWRVTVTATSGSPRRQSCTDDRLKPVTDHHVGATTRLG